MVGVLVGLCHALRSLDCCACRGVIRVVVITWRLHGAPHDPNSVLHVDVVKRGTEAL